jgi:hypothetical protein
MKHFSKLFWFAKTSYTVGAEGVLSTDQTQKDNPLVEMGIAALSNITADSQDEEHHMKGTQILA